MLGAVVFPVLLDLNNLISAISKNQASLILGGYCSIGRTSLNHQSDVGSCGGNLINLVDVAVNQHQLYRRTELQRAVTSLSNISGVPVVADLNLFDLAGRIGLGRINLALNYLSLLNQALLISVVALIGNNNVVVLLDVRVVVKVIFVALARLRRLPT